MWLFVTSYQCSKKHYFLFQELPTFWEFVQFLLHVSKNWLDEHWIPINIYCSVCNVDYKAIIHFEYLKDENEFLSEYIKPGSSKDFQHLLQYYQFHHSVNDEDIMEKYLAQLRRQDIEMLYQLYKFDFEAFGYPKPIFHTRSLFFG